MATLETKIEAILFYKGEMEREKDLARLLQVTEEEVRDAIVRLKASLSSRGIRLLTVNDTVELVTAPEASELILALKKDELHRDLGKAGAETLAIILYRGPISRARIDYIRGVNSASMIRSLRVRGLIEQVKDSKNARSMLYAPSTKLLKHLGITECTALPAYEATRKKIEAFEQGIEDINNGASEESVSHENNVPAHSSQEGHKKEMA